MPYKSRKLKKINNNYTYYQDLDLLIKSLFNLPRSKSFASSFGEDVDQIMFYICHYLIFINSLYFGTLAISDCQVISSKLVILSKLLCGLEPFTFNFDFILWEEIVFGIIIWYQQQRLGFRLQYSKLIYFIIDILVIITSFYIITINKEKISSQLMMFYASLNSIVIIFRHIYDKYPANFEYEFDEWATVLDFNDFLNISKEPANSFFFYCYNNFVFTMNIWFLELLSLSISLEVQIIDHLFTLIFTGTLLYYNSRSMFLGYDSLSTWRKWFVRDMLIHFLQITLVYRSSSLCMYTVFGTIFTLINIINSCLRAFMLKVDEKND